MAIAADSSSPTVLPSATDWVDAGVAAASETSVTAATVVASATVATAIADSTITAADTAAVNAVDAAVAAPLAATAGNNDDDARTTSKQASVISNAAKISLRAYFEEADWPLNKALPRGAEFSCGPLRDIMRQYCLEKSQVARQLLNYKKGRYLNTQVSILLNQSNLDERIREGMAMSKPRFVSLTLLRICYPEPSSYGLDFSNLCVVMNSLPPTACTYVRLLASSPDDACFCWLVGVVENWIQDMVERFPKTAAGIPSAQLDFERAKELKMRAFVAGFMEEYNSAGLPPADVCSITFGRLGAFLHLALFHAWSDAICNNKKPLIEFPVDCLVGRYALPVIYYIAGWMLYSASKATTIAADKRPLYFMFAALHTCDERAAKTMRLPISLVDRRKWWAWIYCSREYFDFICRVESIFLANLTLKMMLAYNNGDIVARITESILSHDGMRDRFSHLLGSDNDVDNQLILSYIIERYAKIWGTYFVRHLKRNSGNQIQKLADSQATRTKVAHVVVYAKKEELDNEDTFISDDTPECRALWETATDNVFELADVDDDDSPN
jgi:hypothetical protein